MVGTRLDAAGNDSAPLEDITIRLPTNIDLSSGGMSIPDAHKSQSIRFEIPSSTTQITLREAMKYLAAQNPALRDQLIGSDGSPRFSTGILFNGEPPPSLDTQYVLQGEHGGDHHAKVRSGEPSRPATTYAWTGRFHCIPNRCWVILWTTGKKV